LVKQHPRGIVELNAEKEPDFSETVVGRFELWRQRGQPGSRGRCERLIEMLVDLIKARRKG